MFTWYWLADVCAAEGITFVLGHALAMKAIHGGKAKNDKIDSHKIAVPAARRHAAAGLRLPGGHAGDARSDPSAACISCASAASSWRTSRTRARNTTCRPSGDDSPIRANRDGVRGALSRSECAARASTVDLALIDQYDALIIDLELTIVREAKRHDADAFHRLRSVPGIGKVLALTILYEIHDITRFDRVQEFASYARLVKCQKQSGGKTLGTGGAKMGNVHLKWAFSEAAVLFLRHTEDGKKLLARIEKTARQREGALDPGAQDRARGVLHAVARNGLLDGEVPRGVAGKGAGEPDA